jgi:tricorn protease
VTLAADTPSPFGPLVGGRPVSDDDKDGGKDHAHEAAGGAEANGADGTGSGGTEAGGPGHGDDGQADGAGQAGGAGHAGGDVQAASGDSGEHGTGDEHRPPVRVDTEGLPGRLVPVPVEESRYESLRAVTGGLAWLKNTVTGVLGEGGPDPDGDSPRPCLERFDLRQRNCAEVTPELDCFEVSGDGNWLLVHDHGDLRVTSAERKGGEGPDPVRVDLSRARFLADPVAQWHHAFDEAGRAMRHDFWVPDMAGVDWDAVLADYRPLVSRIRTSDDFADLMWEVCGELGSSHAYVRTAAPGHRPTSLPAPGFLGADLEQDGDGNWRVARVLPGESSDPRARSPLAEPGAAVAPGSRLAAVDGQPVDPAAGPAPLLSGAAGKPVELTVITPAGQWRRVAVVPLASERRLRYQDWVAGNRRKVRELTGGRGGYLHVPDMTGEGWAHFHRDLRAEMARDLLILDVRDNRGGHTSELVVEKLARRVIAWDVPRSMRPETYPRDAPRGPVVALADEFAGSDGDVITAAIRNLGLGPVVGTRTWGGVIGIDDGFTLVDGTRITVPKYALWFGNQGWGVENYGVDPDVEVLITPADWAQGRDPQLDTAVRLGLEALRDHPAARPPDTATRPSRRRPPLPARPGAER